jgi:flavin reductase (DIM6/NTAB) family NADH-FMN oxidoreductase RutF
MDETVLRAVLERLDTTGCVVTAASGGERDGCFISYIAPCSIDPPRLLLLSSVETMTHTLILRSRALAVHPIGRKQKHLFELFGHRTGREVDKLAQIEWSSGETGSPVLREAIAYMEGRVIDTMECGDHTACLVEPVAAELGDPDAIPMTVFQLFARGLLKPSAPIGDPWKRLSGRKPR